MLSQPSPRLSLSLGRLLTLFIVFIAVTACSAQAPAPPAPAQPQTQATQAPAATQAAPAGATAAPAATQASAQGGGCPAATVANMQGVAAGKNPQQYELAEFESVANCKLTLTGRTKYDQRLYDIGFLKGDLPPVEQRLPEEPLVVVPSESIGKYGGRARFASIGPEAGNSEFLSVRHVNFLRFLDDNVTIVPNMAKDYKWNDDYTELTITLRKGHKWSDGEPFTADDVVFWYEDIILNTELYKTPPSAWVYGGEPMKVEKVDDVTVKFKFAVPSPAFTTLLATTYTHEWAPKHYMSKLLPKYNPKANDEAIAAGYKSWQEYFIPATYSDWEDSYHRTGIPKLESWILVQETPEFQLFTANPYYYKVDTAGQQLPYLDEIHQSYAPEKELIDLKIVNGEVDLKAQSLLIASLPLYQQNTAKGNYEIQMAEGAANGGLYAFNCTHKDPELAKLFSNPEFSRAMSLALNRDEINKSLFFGLAKPVQGVPVHWTVTFAKPEWFTKDIEYNPDEANKILDGLGLVRGADGFRTRPDGKPLVIQIVYALQFGDPHKHELAKEYWEKVGVKVELKEVSTDAYRTMASNNDHDIAITDSGTTTEAPLYSNPFRLYPPFGDAALEPICGAPWAEWHASGGKSGIEPPEDVKQLWDLTSKWQASLPGSKEYVELGQQIVEIHMKHFWLIGTTSSPPQVTIVSTLLGNRPKYKINAFEYYRTYPYRPDQWYFTTLPKGQTAGN